MKKNNSLLIAFIVVIVALLFLWLRENEMRVSAQSKLANLEFKATSVINEKGEAIADLSTQVGEMQARLQQTTDEAVAAVADRDALIQKMEEDARVAAAEYEKTLAGLETKMQEDSKRSDEALKKKNTELSEMGEELRKTTERLAAVLKEKEKAESESYDTRQQMSASQRKLDKLRDDNKRLEALAKVCVEPTTADGPGPV